jgi:cysteine-rich repeat protein
MRRTSSRTRQGKLWMALLALTLAACGGAELSDLEGLEVEEPALTGGTVTATGELEAVGRVNGGGCTGTLITPDTVLTAGHCVCSGSQTTPVGQPPAYTCSRAQFTFVNVRPASNPAVRVDVTVGGNVTVHPNYTIGAWLSNDYALIRLDKRVQQLAYGVKPIEVERPYKKPKAGDVLTLVGYGSTGTGCSTSGGGLKRKVTLPVQSIVTYANTIAGETIWFKDGSHHSCPGDSGGPALSAAGRVVGVASTGDFNTNSDYDVTHLIYSWLSSNACTAFDPAIPDGSFCNDPLCPCEHGAGDCDYDYHCKTGNCVHDVGSSFGLPASWDVCVHCPVFNPATPDGSFCNNPYCPCEIGEGDCDTDAQCAPGLICGLNNGPAFGLPTGWDACIKPGPTCGNGQPDPGEACDDANTVAHDGCSPTCQVESGWVCPRWDLCIKLPSSCFPKCAYEL